MNKRTFSKIGVLCIPVVLFLFFSLVTEGFGLHSFTIVLSQSMIPSCIGYGLCVLIVCGLMDFSVGCRMVFSGVVGAVCYQFWGVAGFILGVLVAAFGSGIIVAIMYRFMKIPAMVISFGTVLLAEAFSYKCAQIIGNSNYVTIPAELAEAFAYPYNILWTLLAGVILYILNYHTRIGPRFSAVGNDEVLANSLGIKAEKVKTQAYLVSSIFVAFAAFLQIGYSGMLGIQLGSATMSMTFKPMMGAIIGMTLLPLWNNMPLMILFGELCIAILFNGLIAAGMDDFYQSLVLGFFLLLVLGVSGNIGMFQERLRRNRVKKLGVAAYVKEKDVV